MELILAVQDGISSLMTVRQKLDELVFLRIKPPFRLALQGSVEWHLVELETKQDPRI